MLWDDLEGRGKEGWEAGSGGRGHMYTYSWFSFCTEETNTMLENTYTSIKKKKKDMHISYLDR